MIIGLEAIAFDVPRFFISMTELAHARQVDPEKFTVGIGQREMAVPTPCEDSVVLAGQAGLTLLKEHNIDPASIALLIVGSETGVDHSKPISSYVHKILGLSHACRSFEVKHACYGAMAGITMAVNYLLSGRAKGRKALVIATDIARYGKETLGEPTQGAGAVALLISDCPRLIAFDTQHEGFYAKHVMDFWRPLYSKEPYVNGQYSIQCYLQALEGAYSLYKQSALGSGRDLFNQRFHACLYHAPFVKMTQKAHIKLLEIDQQTIFEKDSPLLEAAKQDFKKRVAPYLELNARVGNIYTGSLFLSLINYLEDFKPEAINRPLSLFSYGSGCGAEFMSAALLSSAQEWRNRHSFRKQLAQREQISIPDYEKCLEACGRMDLIDQSVCDPSLWNLDRPLVYLGNKEHKRIYSLEGVVINDTR